MYSKKKKTHFSQQQRVNNCMPQNSRSLFFSTQIERQIQLISFFQPRIFVYIFSLISSLKTVYLNQTKNVKTTCLPKKNKLFEQTFVCPNNKYCHCGQQIKSYLIMLMGRTPITAHN